MSKEYLQDVELDHSPIPAGCIQILNEITIPRHGEVWRIYRNDADPFPSSPHAHNPESGLKLHLGNGELYRGASNTGKTISKKDLVAIRSQIKGVTLPSLTI